LAESGGSSKPFRKFVWATDTELIANPNAIPASKRDLIMFPLWVICHLSLVTCQKHLQ
jgi:hypothetical protein